MLKFWGDIDIDTTTHFASPVQVCGTVSFFLGGGVGREAPKSPIGVKGGLRIQPTDMP